MCDFDGWGLGLGLGLGPDDWVALASILGTTAVFGFCYLCVLLCPTVRADCVLNSN
jgi:hypothetical protein